MQMQMETCQDFEKRFPGNIHYDSYRRQIKKINISFVKLEEEDCELCDKHTLHMERHGEVENCKFCELFAYHKERYDLPDHCTN